MVNSAGPMQQERLSHYLDLVEVVFTHTYTCLSFHLAPSSTHSIERGDLQTHIDAYNAIALFLF
jgi:hypothetical protein